MTADTADKPKKSAGKVEKVAASPAVKKQKTTTADVFLTWMPIDERTGRPLDGRNAEARQIRARLQSYSRDLTGGRRSLSTAEAGALRLLVSIEFDHARALSNQARGSRAGDDITRLASEWRRQLQDLGLGLPGASQWGNGVPAGAGPDRKTDLTLLTDDELDTLERLFAKASSEIVDPEQTLVEFVGRHGADWLDFAKLSEYERVLLAPVLQRHSSGRAQRGAV